MGEEEEVGGEEELGGDMVSGGLLLFAVGATPR
jgi:hypothetical protein